MSCLDRTIKPLHFFYPIADAIKAHAAASNVTVHAIAVEPHSPGADRCRTEVLSNAERHDMVLLAGETLRVAAEEHPDLFAEVQDIILPRLRRIRAELHDRAMRKGMS